MESLILPWRILAYIGIAAAIHAVVLVIRHLAGHFLRNTDARRYRKLRSLATVLMSATFFALYFLLFGLILSEFGISLTAYLTSATVIGLAVGFGSQGIVQDVITGLTLIFSDLIDVGDLVEISGQTGVVRSITMRFVELENPLGATVFIPNRTIGNVINYPRGYVRCLVDVTLLGDAPAKARMHDAAARRTYAFHEQFPGILLTPPSVEGRQRVSSGKEYLRLKFRIWPNRGGPIETVFVPELLAALKRENEEYQSWMIAVSYEAEARAARPAASLLWPIRARKAKRSPGAPTAVDPGVPR
ncbi:MAG TPA: mechanosensitive ion channel domain-containing protein [Gammaproteobacteria bacterium]